MQPLGHLAALRLGLGTAGVSPVARKSFFIGFIESLRHREAPRYGSAWGPTDSSSIHPDRVEELQLETRVTRSPSLEVEVELPPRLPLGRSVGDDDLDRVIVDLVGNAAAAVEEVAQVAAKFHDERDILRPLLR